MISDLALFINAAEQFINEKSVDDKFYLSDLRDFLSRCLGLPSRTYQWYLYEDILPKPEPEGRRSFYSVNVALEVLRKAILMHELKRYTTIRVSTIKAIFKKHHKYNEEIIELLINLIEQCPAFEEDPTVKGDYQNPRFRERFNQGNANLAKLVCEKLSKANTPSKVSITELMEE